VPQRGFCVSFERGGSMLSLIAVTRSHGDVYDAVGVAAGARLTTSGSGSTVTVTRLAVVRAPSVAVSSSV
jgi:hypothetical protein